MRRERAAGEARAKRLAVEVKAESRVWLALERPTAAAPVDAKSNRVSAEEVLVADLRETWRTGTGNSYPAYEGFTASPFCVLSPVGNAC